MKRTVERINWDLVGPELFEYHRAVYGNHLPLPPHEADVVAQFGPAGWRVVEEAAAAILVTKNVLIYRRPKDFRTCDQIVVDFLEARTGGSHSHGSRVWHSFLSLALAIAKRDTRYWRVEDPTVESYCSYCRRKRTIDQFTKHEGACDRHNLRRGHHHGHKGE